MIADVGFVVVTMNHERTTFPAGTMVLVEEGCLHCYTPATYDSGETKPVWLASFSLWNVLRWGPGLS